jgi:hypothetical protein
MGERVGVATSTIAVAAGADVFVGTAIVVGDNFVGFAIVSTKEDGVIKYGRTANTINIIITTVAVAMCRRVGFSGKRGLTSQSNRTPNKAAPRTPRIR